MLIIIIIIIILLLITHKFAYACIWSMRVTQIGWFKLKKRVLTKDLTVVKFFSCLMWWGKGKTEPVPGVGFSVARLDRAIFGFYRFESFLNCLLFHSDIDFT